MSAAQPPAWSLVTRLVHAGERKPPPPGIPTATPIYTTVTYGYPDARAFDAAFESDQAYLYTRHGNPTIAALEQVLAVAEAGVGAVAFGSGMAALHAALLAAGTPRGSTHPQIRRILASRDLYGETTALLETFFAAQGIPVTYCDSGNLADVTAALATVQPDVMLVELLSNPLVKLVDVEAVAQLVHTIGARLVVDNTLATPILQQPLTLGADLVVHSATKYLGGHCAATAGMAVARSALVQDTLRAYAKLLGPVLGPFEAHLILLGIKTLALRMRQQCTNAATIASWLTQQPAVARVYYPGLPAHPQHDLACHALGGLFGAIVSFELGATTRAALFRFLDGLRLIVPVTSLGDVYTLATAPSLSSHRNLTVDQRRERGIGESLVRLSIGIEQVDDLIGDLAGALRGVAQAEGQGN